MRPLFSIFLIVFASVELCVASTQAPETIQAEGAFTANIAGYKSLQVDLGQLRLNAKYEVHLRAFNPLSEPIQLGHESAASPGLSIAVSQDAARPGEYVDLKIKLSTPEMTRNISQTVAARVAKDKASIANGVSIRLTYTIQDLVCFAQPNFVHVLPDAQARVSFQIPMVAHTVCDLSKLEFSASPELGFLKFSVERTAPTLAVLTCRGELPPKFERASGQIRVLDGATGFKDSMACYLERLSTVEVVPQSLRLVAVSDAKLEADVVIRVNAAPSKPSSKMASAKDIRIQAVLNGAKTQVQTVPIRDGIVRAKVTLTDFESVPSLLENSREDGATLIVSYGGITYATKCPVQLAESPTARDAFDVIKLNSELVRQFDVLVRIEELKDQSSTGGIETTTYRRMIFDFDREVALCLTNEQQETVDVSSSGKRTNDVSGMLIRGPSIVIVGTKGRVTSKAQSFAHAVWRMQVQPYRLAGLYPYPAGELKSFSGLAETPEKKLDDYYAGFWARLMPHVRLHPNSTAQHPQLLVGPISTANKELSNYFDLVLDPVSMLPTQMKLLVESKGRRYEQSREDAVWELKGGAYVPVEIFTQRKAQYLAADNSPQPALQITKRKLHYLSVNKSIPDELLSEDVIKDINKVKQLCDPKLAE